MYIMKNLHRLVGITLYKIVESGLHLRRKPFIRFVEQRIIFRRTLQNP